MVWNMEAEAQESDPAALLPRKGASPALGFPSPRAAHDGEVSARIAGIQPAWLPASGHIETEQADQSAAPASFPQANRPAVLHR